MGQRGVVVWLFGLSGSGKTTLAAALERRLYQDHILTKILDGENIRTGLNQYLGFSDEDRKENVRRIAELARLGVAKGIITIVSVITPKRDLRKLAREIIGSDDYVEVYVHCKYDTCERRDVKGGCMQRRSPET